MLHTTKPRISNHINFIECESTKQGEKKYETDWQNHKKKRQMKICFIFDQFDWCVLLLPPKICNIRFVFFCMCFFLRLFVHSLYFGNGSIQVSSFITYASFGCLYLWILCERERLTDWMMSTNRKFSKNKLWKVRDKTAESVSLRI